MSDDRGASRDASDVDPIDVEAAQIDARSPDAAEDVAGLAEHAAELGRDTDAAPVEIPDDVDVADPSS
jgi:hypothetical protein